VIRKEHTFRSCGKYNDYQTLYWRRRPRR